MLCVTSYISHLYGFAFAHIAKHARVFERIRRFHLHTSFHQCNGIVEFSPENERLEPESNLEMKKKLIFHVSFSEGKCISRISLCFLCLQPARRRENQQNTPTTPKVCMPATADCQLMRRSRERQKCAVHAGQLLKRKEFH